MLIEFYEDLYGTLTLFRKMINLFFLSDQTFFGSFALRISFLSRCVFVERTMRHDSDGGMHSFFADSLSVVLGFVVCIIFLLERKGLRGSFKEEYVVCSDSKFVVAS